MRRDLGASSAVMQDRSRLSPCIASPGNVGSPVLSSLGHHGDNLLIKAAKAPLSFADKLRIKLPSAVPRHLDFQLTILAQEDLFTGPVAVVFGLLVPGRGLPFLVAKVVGHLGPKNPLVDPFG